MSDSMAVGSHRREKKQHGLFTMQWVTVWGVYVPHDWTASLELYLDLNYGLETKALGNTIQVQWDPEDPDRVERVRDIIRDYAKAAWKRPLEGEAREFFRERAEELIRAREEARR